MRSHPQNIAVITKLSTPAGRAFLAGVLRFMRQRKDWNLMLFQNHGTLATVITRPDLANSDAIITSELSDNLQEILQTHPRPLALVGSWPPEVLGKRTAPTIRVCIDNIRIGRAGAEYLMGLGRFASFGFVRYATHGFERLNDLREKGFVQALTRQRQKILTFDPASGRNLGEWLLSLPLPAALMSGNAAHSEDVLAACKKAGINVPGQLMLLGVDNDDLLCDSLSPRLSTLCPDFEEQGFLAARAIARALASKAASADRTILTTGNPEIRERQSATFLSPATHLIDRALDFISENARRDISVEDVIHHLRVSRRLAEMRFRQFQKKSINDCIIEAKLKEMRRLLEQTDGTVSSIAAACGFRNTAYAMTLFRKRTGNTMSGYRKGKRPHPWQINRT